MKSDGPGVLSDHRRRGKKLIPPLLAMMGDRYAPYSWAREIVPELIWIALLIDEFGIKDGADLAIELMKTCDVFSNNQKRPHLSMLTSYEFLSSQQKLDVLQKLGTIKTAKLRQGLRCLNQLCPDNPLSFFANSADANDAQNSKLKLAFLLPRLYDRYSKEAALTMATAMYVGAAQGIIQFVGDLFDKFREDLNHITDYPKTDRAKAAAASFRASAATFQHPLQENRSHDDWLECFWGNVAGIGECTPNLPPYLDEIPEDPIGNTIFTFRNAVKKELYARIAALGFDLNKIEPYEVVGALLARQATLAIEIALNPNCWTSHLAPMLLRGMADVHITLTWIFGDLEERSKRFVDDGLGAIKLEIAHRRREMAKSDDDDPENVKQMKADIVDTWEKWLDSQRIGHLVEVNLGAWSGLSTRKMAEESDNISFYNYVFQPFSAAVHSNWAHVSMHNTLYCENPAHRFHRIPTAMSDPNDAFWLYLAGKYLEKTFMAFDKRFKIRITEPKAFEILVANLDQYRSSEEDD